MRLLTKSFPAGSARLGNFAFVSIIVLRIERIALGSVGRITVLSIKRPQVWARVQLLGTLHVYHRLELHKVDVCKESKHPRGDQDNEEILEYFVEETKGLGAPRRKFRTKPVGEWSGEHLLEICGVA